MRVGHNNGDPNPELIWTSDSSVWKTLERNALRALFYSVGYDALNYLVKQYTIISALRVGPSRLYKEPNVVLLFTTALQKSVLKAWSGWY